jgi:hypothetical protein
LTACLLPTKTLALPPPLEVQYLPVFCNHCQCEDSLHTRLEYIAGEVTPVCHTHGNCWFASDVFTDRVERILNLTRGVR